MDNLLVKLRALGNDFTPEQIVATRGLFAPLALRPADVDAVVHRDLRYGPDARNRLDIFSPSHGGAERPVAVFVHGGGFVQGDKGEAGAPFYNNFGAWAVRSGFVGVTLTYRLAPAHVWPSGGEDVALAMQWLAAHVGAYGGAPTQMVAVGQSAGATHVASCLAGQGVPAGMSVPMAGAVLLSGVFDLSIADRIAPNLAYYGSDASVMRTRSTIDALGSTAVPCLFTVSEFDPSQFQRQAAAVVSARMASTGCMPEMLYLHGHNHVSTIMQLGSPVDTLGEPLAKFVRRVSGSGT